MTLSFSRELNGKPSYFVEKIWKWLIYSGNKTFENTSFHYECEYESLYPCQYTDQENIHYHNPKLHTIRRDKKNRWKAGNLIHPVINNRQPDRLQFAPEFPCVSTQYFQVLYEGKSPTVFIGLTEQDWTPFYIEDDDHGVVYGEDQMKELAKNDGFNSVADFFEYFNTDFEGKIIHWTDKVY